MENPTLISGSQVLQKLLGMRAEKVRLADGNVGEPRATGQDIWDPSSQHFSLAEGLEEKGGTQGRPLPFAENLRECSTTTIWKIMDVNQKSKALHFLRKLLITLIVSRTRGVETTPIHISCATRAW